jgi:hypothetical protein
LFELIEVFTGGCGINVRIDIKRADVQFRPPTGGAER